MMRTILNVIAMLLTITTTATAASPKIKYPGGKQYIWRYTLKDKQGSPYSLEHPGRWLSRKSIERRKRQGLKPDSTDLPVSPQYLKSLEKTAIGMVDGNRKSSMEWAIIAFGAAREPPSMLVWPSCQISSMTYRLYIRICSTKKKAPETDLQGFA